MAEKDNKSIGDLVSEYLGEAEKGELLKSRSLETQYHDDYKTQYNTDFLNRIISDAQEPKTVLNILHADMRKVISKDMLRTEIKDLTMEKFDQFYYIQRVFDIYLKKFFQQAEFEYVKNRRNGFSHENAYDLAMSHFKDVILSLKSHKFTKTDFYREFKEFLKEQRKIDKKME